MAQCRILVVDDSAIITKVVSRALATAGYEVDSVTSSLQVTAKMLEFKPDLVLLDLKMPGLGGEHIIELAAKRKYGFDFKVVIHSSENEDRLREVAGKPGVIGYIRKESAGDGFMEAVKRFARQCCSEFDSPAASHSLGGKSAEEELRGLIS